MTTRKKRQPVQIDGAIMNELRVLAEVLGGMPITRLVRSACVAYLENSEPYQAHLKSQGRAKKRK